MFCAQFSSILKKWVPEITIGGRVHWIVPGGQFLEKDLGQVTDSLIQWVREAK